MSDKRTLEQFLVDIQPLPGTYRRQLPRLYTQFWDIFLIQLSNWRWSWRGMIVTGTITPLLSIVALGMIVNSANPETLIYILTGNIVLSLMFENQNKVASNFAYMQAMGTINFFATLPISRYMLILATVASFLLLSLPSLIVTILFGTSFLGISLSVSPLIALIIPLCALPLAGIGAFIGLTMRSPEEASSMSLLVTLILVGVGPVLLPASRLPDALLYVSYISPTTYAASALRQTLIGPVTERLVLDIVVLAGLTLVILWVVGFKLSWRVK